MHKLAIVGYGGIAGWHHALLQEIENIEIAGIWDVKAGRRTLAQAKGLHVYGSLEDLLADASVELVLIATPNDLHKPIAVRAMEAGKHVICEKPITLSSADLQEMMQVAQRTGTFLTVHQNRRWDTDFCIVQKILETGKLGEIYRIESRVHGARGIPGDWRQEPEHGGGMVLDWGVHLLDQALLLFPGEKVSTVYATVTHVSNQKVDDGFFADLGLSNGVHICVEVGTSNFVTLPRWYVLGVNGTAVIEDWKLNGRMVTARGIHEKDAVPVITAAGLTKTMAPRRPDTIFTAALPQVESDIHEFYQNVLAVIEGKEKSRIPLPQVMRVMRLMEAIFASAQSKSVIKFE